MKIEREREMEKKDKGHEDRQRDGKREEDMKIQRKI